MASGHCKIIRENRVYLCKNIDVQNSLVLDQLVQDQVISQTQLNSLKDTTHNNCQRVSALLDILDKKSSREWAKFLEGLSLQEHEHVVQKLSSGKNVPLGHLDEDIRKLQRRLARIFLEQYDKIELWSLQDDHVAVPMNELYVDLVWVQTKHGSMGRRYKKLESYTELFPLEEDMGSRKFIYLLGEPGVGKSTMVRRISVDWARVMLGQETDERRDVLRQFKLVLPIFLRYVEQGNKIEEVLQEEYRLTPKDASVLSRVLAEFQESILILMDGYDEYREATSSEITDIAHRKHSSYVQLLITSRHPPASSFANDRYGPNCEVWLRGFSTEGVKEYLNKYFHDSEEKASKLLVEIQNSEELKQLSHYPAVLLMMAELWVSGETLFKTVTEFYLGYVEYVCCRFEKKDVRSDDRVTDVIKKYHASLMKIGEIGSQGMKSDRLALSFPYRSVIGGLDDTTWRLGFLKEGPGIAGGRLVSFPHKTVQEFFTSYYIVHCSEDKQRELLMHFCGSLQAFRESSMIVKFVAGLGGEDIRTKIERIIKGNDVEVAGIHTDLQLSFLSENKDVQLEMPSRVKLCFSEKYLTSVFTQYLSLNGSALTSLTLHSPDLKHVFLLQYLRAPNLKELALLIEENVAVDYLNETYITQTLDSSLNTFPLRILKVNLSMFTQAMRDERILDEQQYGTLLTIIFSAIQQMWKLDELSFIGTRLGGRPVREIVERLPSSRLTNLNMIHCFLDMKEVQDIFTTLPKCQLLSTMQVFGCEITNIGVTKSFEHLAKSHLISLDLSSCNLSIDDISSLCEILPKCYTLKHLTLAKNNICGLHDIKTKLECIAQSQVEQLNIRLNELSIPDVLLIAECISRSRSLTSLDISGSNLKGLAGNEAGIGKLFQSQLQKLIAERCNLSADDIASLAQVLPCDGKMKCMNLSNNHLGDQIEKLNNVIGKLSMLDMIDLSENAVSEPMQRKIEENLLHVNPKITVLT